MAHITRRQFLSASAVVAGSLAASSCKAPLIKSKEPSTIAGVGICPRVHIFYYDWYGAPRCQSDYVHWQQGGHTPPEDIGSNFYPQLGPYSSADPKVLQQHMSWIADAGVGVLCVTWWGQGSYEEQRVSAILDTASSAKLKVAFHLEPYHGLTPGRLSEDVRYLLSKYGNHEAFYRADNLNGRPMFYVFESLRHAAPQWQSALAQLRRSAEPIAMIGQTSDVNFIESAGFDGGYTYDVLTPFKNPQFLLDWTQVVGPNFAARGKLFIPSVGPGYWDDRAVPVNGADEPPSARTRDEGRATTFDKEWQTAIEMRAPFITITSFNEWHEGSQIEPAKEKQIQGYKYPGYDGGSMAYIRRTKQWVGKYAASLRV